jgi:hypothetical protein
MTPENRRRAGLVEELRQLRRVIHRPIEVGDDDLPRNNPPTFALPQSLPAMLDQFV